MKNQMLLLLVLIFLLVGLGVFLNFKNPTQKSAKTISFKDISPQELDKILATRNTFLVDVHIPEQKHLEGTDLVISYNKIKENLDKFPKNKNAEIIVYCKSGRMSIEASNALLEAGYTRVYNLAGGLNAYYESHYGIYIDPVTKNLGKVVYGNVAKTSLKLINNTKKEITITKISTSCSCTSATTVKKNLEPYEDTEVLVSFNPAVHKDDTDLGEVIKTIYIDTTSDNFPRVEASITATVVKNKNKSS